MSQGQSNSNLPKKYQGTKIWSYGNGDPTSIPTLGAKNQFYVNLDDGTLYQKNDEGVTTNWSICAFSTSGPSQITVNGQNGVEELDFQGEIAVNVSGNTATLTLPKRVGTVGGFTDTDTLVIGSGLNATQSNPNEVTLTATSSGIDVDSNSGVTKIVSGTNLSSTSSGPNEVTLDVTIPTPTITVDVVSGVNNIQVGSNLSVTNDGGGQVTLDATIPTPTINVGAFSGISTISAGTGISITNPVSGTAEISSTATPTGTPRGLAYYDATGNLSSDANSYYDTVNKILKFGKVGLPSGGVVGAAKNSIIFGETVSGGNAPVNSLIFGNNVDVRNSQTSLVFGTTINAKDCYTAIIGGSNINLTNNSAAIGSGVVVGSNFSIAYSGIGYSFVTGEYFTLNGNIGSDSTLSRSLAAANHITINSSTHIFDSLLVGKHTFNANSTYLSIIGESVSLPAITNYCFIHGKNSTDISINSTLNHVFMFGDGHKAFYDHQIAFGKFSQLNDANTMFVLGYGANDSTRINVFDVGNDGLIREYGGKRVKVSVQSGATYTLNARTDYAIEFTNGGAITITLPSGVDGQKYEIKLTGGTSATINAASGETINGLSSYLLGINLCCSLLFRNGNWLVCADDTEVIDYDNLSKYMSDKDTGVFKTIEWKTSAGVLRKKSVLSGGTAPQFTTRTVTFYDQTGTIISSKTLTYTLSYDVDGDITSEVL